VKGLFESVPVDRDAEERTWQVVRAAFEEREPVARRRPPYAIALVAVAAVVVAAALSPPGRAVVDAVKRTLGVEHASPALFRLPAAGRLLVSGPGGAWIIEADGSKRHLGDYREAAWSPHGLFVAGAAANELAAIDPNGDVHWSLGRPDVRAPRWGGSLTDTRISYLSGGRLHVVGGNGKGDHVLGIPSSRVAPSWRPNDKRQLAIVTPAGRVVLYDADTNSVLWRTHAYPHPRAIAWSSSGTELVLATATQLVFIRDGKSRAVDLPGVRAVAISRSGVALLRGNTVSLLDGEPHRLFAAPGHLAGLAWSPNGKWLATTLPAAGQLIFVGPRVVAVSNAGGISLDGWLPNP